MKRMSSNERRSVDTQLDGRSVLFFGMHVDCHDVSVLTGQI